MKYRIASDFHTEILEIQNPTKMGRLVEKYMLPVMEGEKEQTLLFAGDLGNYRQRVALKAVLENFSSRFAAVYYIPGNHEYYNDDLELTTQHIDEIANEFSNVLFSPAFKKYNIVGTTLWTDFSNSEEYMAIAGHVMNDYRKITNGNRPAIPEDMKALHEIHKEFINDFTNPLDIVMTHHLPSFLSIDPQYVRYAELNPAYASDLNKLIEKKKPKLWIHGHTHASQDYMIGDTRIICNPYGYHGHDVNKNYNPYLVVEV